MLELNLTGLQKGGSASNPSQDEVVKDEIKTEEVAEVITEVETPKEEVAEVKPPKLGLSLSSLMGKKEEVAIEVAVAKEEVAIIEDSDSVTTEEITEIISSELPAEEITTVSEEEDADNGMSLSSLKSDSDEAKKAEAEKAAVAEIKAEAEEKKEYFPSFNALGSFEESDMLGLNKNFENLANGESQSILAAKEIKVEAKEVVAEIEEIPEVIEEIPEVIVAEEEPEEIIAEEEILDAEEELEEVTAIEEQALDINNTEVAPENAEAGNTDEIKEDLSKKRAFAGLTPFKKKVMIYSIAAFAICGIGLAGIIGGGDTEIKVSINDIKPLEGKYKEGVDFSINKNKKKNIRKNKEIVPATMTGETLSGETSTGTTEIPSTSLINEENTVTSASGAAVPQQEISISGGLDQPNGEPGIVEGSGGIIGEPTTNSGNLGDAGMPSEISPTPIK